MEIRGGIPAWAVTKLKEGDEVCFYSKINELESEGNIVKKIGNRYGFGTEEHNTYKTPGTLLGSLKRMDTERWDIRIYIK